MPTESELEYLYGLERFGIKPGLAVMQQIMELLGHPEQQFKSIHVTGTNGKGSTCAMIESILRTSGYKTALYTSPHLYAFNERIREGGESISDEDLIQLVAEIRLKMQDADIQPTFFEFTTALAFLHFARSNIDIAVIEVGMGGRFDATNVITPLLSVITNVGLDHMEYLGETAQEIAYEKAGIIKEGVPVVTAEQDASILAIFDAEAVKKHTSVVRVGDVVQANIVSSNLEGQEVELSFRPPSRNLRVDPGSRPGMTIAVHLPLLGSHQIENMKTAIAAVIPLIPTFSKGMALRDAIAVGIVNTVWEGRLQIISENPLMIVDGAHNQGGALALAEFLATLPRTDTIVFAVKKGKNISDMMHAVIPLFSHVVITEGSYMPEDAEILAKKISEVHSNVAVEKDVSRAIYQAKRITPQGGTIVITGSLYMVADALACLKKI
ncbi:MAG: bifunctional folylpolyglutamate synthase/dihydrofolate synthase [bacterium]|nr:bifunctional folylpolyglutamate synthase/dihydrofolate synthase [bacterium]